MSSVTDGLLNSVDERLVSFLVLLDLSAAFDTLDHKILLDRPSLTFGIHGTALKWFTSNPLNRTQSVFTSLALRCSPRSVVGPIPFTVYIRPLPCVINDHSFH